MLEMIFARRDVKGVLQIPESIMCRAYFQEVCFQPPYVGKMHAGVIISLAFVAFATFVAWKLVRNTNLRRELRSQRDLLRTAFADISHQTVQHCKYAALMAKVIAPPLLPAERISKMCESHPSCL